MQKIFLSLFALALSVFSFSQNIDVQHYEFNITLSDRSDTIIGKASVEVKFLTASKQFSLDLASVEKGKGMDVVGVFDNGLPVEFTHKNDKLTINTNAKAGETKDFDIQYIGVPRDGLIISKNRFEDRTFFADNWPNRAHHWIPCNDRPDDKASFEFIVTAPYQYKIISNGVRVSEQPLESPKHITHWKEDIALPTKVMVIGAARFAVKQYANSPKNIPVTAWIFPQDSTKGFSDYAVAPEILQFFSSYIAPYPYKKLANVQSKTIFGGMENASAIFYAEGSVTGKGTAEDLLAHEIAHQWFGDMASEKSFAHLWLSEGFATYFTNLYFEKKYGQEKMRERMEEDRKDIIRFVKENNHPVVDTTADYMELLNANSYQKGGWVLHMLRSEVGDSVFHRIIQMYYQQYKGNNADTRDFERVAEKVSGKDLKWFFDQWLYRPGIPDLKMETKFGNGELTFYVKQKGEPYRFNLEIMIVDEDGTMNRERFEIKDKESEFTVLVKGLKASFSIDPDVKLLFNYKD